MNRLSELKKLEVVAIRMGGEALTWFQWEDGRRPICSWDELKSMFLEQFRSSQDGTICEKFLVLRLKGCLDMDYSPCVDSTKHPLNLTKATTSNKESIPNSNALVKHLTNLKLQARKAKGLCFHCDEKYLVGHCCKNKALQVLVVHDDTDDVLIQLTGVDEMGATSEIRRIGG
ncbi:hypothetical protein PanWU01x14_327570 [Parasponia andersonii]|uniref:Uncharacterized protein n=1 Tax=Parasponia andersonii TaxID=3476 RepID=A0A2P5AJ48_PARAD|nr:hypothetical protein PanWU01x14_327570 [Parasponia andersonii]